MKKLAIFMRRVSLFNLGTLSHFYLVFSRINVVVFRFLLFFLRELDRAGQPARVGGAYFVVVVVSGFTEKSSQLVNTHTHSL